MEEVNLNVLKLLSKQKWDEIYPKLIAYTLVLLKIKYCFFDIENLPKGFQLKDLVSEAFDAAEWGNAEVITENFGQIASSVTIQRATFAYKISSSSTEYLQPCYFFEGTDTNGQLITLIVPAVRDEYLTVK